MKIRRKRNLEMVIDNPDLFRVEAHAEYGGKAGWMEGSLATKTMHRFYSSGEWEEVPEETWEDVTSTIDTDWLNYWFRQHYSHMTQLRCKRDEGWVKVSELVEKLRCLGPEWGTPYWSTVDKQATKLQRPVLLVERKVQKCLMDE